MCGCEGGEGGGLPVKNSVKDCSNQLPTFVSFLGRWERSGKIKSKEEADVD